MRVLLIILMVFVAIAAYILGGWFTIWLSKVTKSEEIVYSDRDSFNQNVGCMFFWPVMLIILIPLSLYYFVKSSFIFFHDILFDTPKNVHEDKQTFEDEKKIEI